MGVTKVGPADKSDFPRKKGCWHRIFRFLYVASGFAWFAQVFRFLPISGTRRALDEVNKDDPGFHYKPPPGIPEADMPDAQREAAVARIKQEQAIRRAKGE